MTNCTLKITDKSYWIFESQVIIFFIIHLKYLLEVYESILKTTVFFFFFWGFVAQHYLSKDFSSSRVQRQEFKSSFATRNRLLFEIHRARAIRGTGVVSSSIERHYNKFFFFFSSVIRSLPEIFLLNVLPSNTTGQFPHFTNSRRFPLQVLYTFLQREFNFC